MCTNLLVVLIFLDTYAEISGSFNHMRHSQFPGYGKDHAEMINTLESLWNWDSPKDLHT